ncbi:MAG: phosphate/phosphite/phosphonate ABC transporter substrate-binding protein [Phycisphaerales bacterium]|jgi:phosphonate transport system substrate-binding protein
MTRFLRFASDALRSVWHGLPARVRFALPRSLALPLLAASLLLTGCDSKSNDPPAGGPHDAAVVRGSSTPDPTPASDDRTGWPKSIRVGLVPVEGGADTKARWAPLGEAIEKRLKLPVELVSTSTYQGVITAMGNDQLEFAYMGPKSYVEAANRAKGEALLVELNEHGVPGYHCIFIVPAASAIKTLQEATGKKFAFTDINSTSGYLIPAMTLLDVTGKPADKYFGQVTFSGSHSTSLLQVASGEIDVAATNDVDTNYAVEKGTVKADSFRVIYTSELIPGSPMVCRKDIPNSLKLAFVAAVLDVCKDKALLAAIKNGGFQPTTDQQFDVIRASQKFLDAQTKDAQNKESQTKDAKPTPPKPAGG